MNNLFEQPSQRIAHLVQSAEARALSTRGLGGLLQAAQAFGEDQCSHLAAALSYYGLLSIFPLLLFILAVASPFIQSESAIRAVTRFVTQFLPSGELLVRNNLQEVARLRGAVTLAAAVGFLWSASGVFNLIQVGLNRAFRVSRRRPMWREKLVSMAMVVGVSILFGLSFLITNTMRVVTHYRILQRQNPMAEPATVLVAITLSIAVFGILYRYVPYDPAIRWRDIALGAVLAAILWEIAKLGFAWYITNLSPLNLVYGSVGAVIALMLWGYVTWVIVLFCAELAAVGMRARRRPASVPSAPEGLE